MVVSACLCGQACRYDGTSCYDEEVARLVKEGKAIPVCPELLGGLPVPRNPAEIVGSAQEVLDGKGKIITCEGEDVTEEFVKGAYEALKIAQDSGAKTAILKAKSPTCGCGFVYDGTFSKKLVPGEGIFAALCKRNGITVRSI